MIQFHDVSLNDLVWGNENLVPLLIIILVFDYWQQIVLDTFYNIVSNFQSDYCKILYRKTIKI
jgi:hypothetical protein